ncbi:MAG: hypothetical protein ACRDHS_00845, partial [Actinomycetota bacterium]
GLFRLSVFGPSGDYARSAPIRDWLRNGMTPYDFRCNPAGVIAFVNRTPEIARPPSSEGPLSAEVEVVVVGPTGSVTNLGRFPASEMYFKTPAAGPRHLGKRTTVGVGSKSVWIGTGDRYEVLQLSHQGERMSGVKEPTQVTRAVTDRQVQQYVDAYFDRRPPRANTPQARQFFRELEWPRTYPAFARVLVDWADNLWIEEYPIPGTPTTQWAIYSPAGVKIAGIALPSDLRLFEAGSDYVLGAWRDEFGVDYVRLYTLLK